MYVSTRDSHLLVCPADRFLLLFRTMKCVSSKYNLPSTPPPDRIRGDDEDFPLSNIMLDLDSMMTICRQQVSSSPVDFIFCEGFPSPTIPRESPTYLEQYNESVTRRGIRIVRVD